MMEDMCKIGCASEVRHSTCKDDHSYIRIRHEAF